LQIAIEMLEEKGIKYWLTRKEKKRERKERRKYM